MEEKDLHLPPHYFPLTPGLVPSYDSANVYKRSVEYCKESIGKMIAYKKELKDEEALEILREIEKLLNSL